MGSTDNLGVGGSGEKLANFQLYKIAQKIVPYCSSCSRDGGTTFVLKFFDPLVPNGPFLCDSFSGRVTGL